MKTEKTKRSYIEVYLADIVSSSQNLRDAVPRLTNEDYGVFEGNDKEKDSLVSLALSDDAMLQKKYIKLIEEHEPEIEALADNMVTMGLLEPICVRPAEEKGKYDLIFGCRRCLAWLCNHAKTAGKIPARITAEVVDADGKLSLLSSLSENMRADPSPIDEAKSFRKLEATFGMKHSEIANAMGKDVKVVRERLKLLKLPLDIQEKVHLGKLAQHKALAMLEGNKGKAPSPDPRRIPHIKAIEKLYHVPHDQLPPEYEPLVTEDVRRLFAHWLKSPYKPQVKAQMPPASEEPAQSQPA